MTRLEHAKELLGRAAALVSGAIVALDRGDPRAAGKAVYDARELLGQVKTTLADEIHLAQLRLEAAETGRLKRAKIGGRP